MSYLKITEVGKSNSGLTKIFSVYATNGSFLGQIKWYGPWRKYCYHAVASQILDANCMYELMEKLSEETNKHKEKREIK